MPTVLCPHCARPTTLPDGRNPPGFTCPRCGRGVVLAGRPPTDAVEVNPFEDVGRAAAGTRAIPPPDPP